VTEEKSKRVDRRAGRGHGGPRRRAREPLPAAQIAQQARQQLSAITELEPETVTSIEQYEDATWRVTVELLELERIPQSDDVIGTYEVDLDETGQLLSYRRIGRYPRSQSQHRTPTGSG
jgi:Gas vesicle synthesis protein GvpO